MLHSQAINIPALCKALERILPDLRNQQSAGNANIVAPTCSNFFNARIDRNIWPAEYFHINPGGIFIQAVLIKFYLDWSRIIYGNRIVEPRNQAVQQALLHIGFATKQGEGLALVPTYGMLDDSPFGKQVPFLRRDGNVLEQPETPCRDNLGRVAIIPFNRKIATTVSPQHNIGCILVAA